jgi:hypothetical protein
MQYNDIFISILLPKNTPNTHTHTHTDTDTVAKMPTFGLYNNGENLLSILDCMTLVPIDNNCDVNHTMIQDKIVCMLDHLTIFVSYKGFLGCARIALAELDDALLQSYSKNLHGSSALTSSSRRKQYCTTAQLKQLLAIGNMNIESHELIHSQLRQSVDEHWANHDTNKCAVQAIFDWTSVQSSLILANRWYDDSFTKPVKTFLFGYMHLCDGTQYEVQFLSGIGTWMLHFVLIASSHSESDSSSALSTVTF